MRALFCFHDKKYPHEPARAHAGRARRPPRENGVHRGPTQHLLKLCHWLEDVEGFDVRLSYLRDVAKREVDFLVTLKGKPWFAVEAKLSATEISPHLRYFGDRVRIPYLYQVVAESPRDFQKDGVRVVAASRFLASIA